MFRFGSLRNFPTRLCPDESRTKRSLLSSSRQKPSRGPGEVAPRVFLGGPDLAHTYQVMANASRAATTASFLPILIVGEVIRQRALTIDPSNVPPTFATRSLTEGSRCIIINWLVSANSEIAPPINV